jgi:hypothetical protein
MSKLTLTRNFAQLTAVFAIMLISISTMGAGCTPTKTPATATDIPQASESAQRDIDENADEETETNSAAATRVEILAPSTTPAAKPATSVNHYKDGTYSATGKYSSPAGAEELPVTLTLKKDVVTDSVVKVVATNQKSKYMQEEFAANYKTSVVGKKLDEVNVGKISRSSLTGIGFNDAVAKIKTQAAIK